MSEAKSIGQIIEEIKNLVNEKGYIYALCMILFEDFRVVLEKIHETDHQSRLSVREVSLLLGFIIQNKIDFSIPDTPQDFFNLKKQTYELMKDLRDTLGRPYHEENQKSIKKEHGVANFTREQKSFFSTGNMLIEPIFYSGGGVYDFQYLDFLERKYRYDKDWLLKNKSFDLEKSKNIVTQIKNILEAKFEKIPSYLLKEKMPELIEGIKKQYPDKDWEIRAKEIIPTVLVCQYIELFSGTQIDGRKMSVDEIGARGWKLFYNGLVELFIIRKSDFDTDLSVDLFLHNFSLSPNQDFNSQFQGVGNFNWFDAKPIIQLDEERYFVPITFSLSEAIYESPFYWMLKEDESYKDQLGKNRGKVGEEISYDFLSRVFGKNRTFESVKITTQKGKDDTDIDVLCILGNKALCVQVKSKKLTQLSRTGDDEQLQKDFQGAIQDAYRQGLISRQKILDRKAKFFDKKGKEIQFSKEINEVYIMGITTENYPSLTHQTRAMLDKKNDEPFPIFFSIFDLELIAHYLNDPYDFLYYIRQRISLMDCFMAEEEMIFLGYHLCEKLLKIPEADLCVIPTDYGKLIDRNYYPLRAGLAVPDEGDAIKAKWRNDDFDRFCDQLKTLDEPRITDAIFYLLDWPDELRNKFMDCMMQKKQDTLRDGTSYCFSVHSGDNYSPRVGATYVSSNSDNLEELSRILQVRCEIGKYKSRTDIWVGFGSLKSGNGMFDAVLFNNQKWESNEALEEHIQKLGL